jgi:hypothetical protein
MKQFHLKAFPPGIVVHACMRSTQKAEARDYEFEASLGYIERTCLNTAIAITYSRRFPLVLCVATFTYESLINVYNETPK